MRVLEYAPMLFEREPLTPEGRLGVLTSLFNRVASKRAPIPEKGHVPQSVLEAYGDLNSHIRYILEAASKHAADRAAHARLRKIEKLLDELPSCIIQTLPAGPQENWLLLYRSLVGLYELLDEPDVGMDAEEFASVMQKMVQLADTVARESAVEVGAASMFTLLLMQIHLHRYSPRKKRPTRRRKSATKKR